MPEWLSDSNAVLDKLEQAFESAIAGLSVKAEPAGFAADVEHHSEHLAPVAVSDLDLGAGSLLAPAAPGPSQVTKAANVVDKSDALEYRPWPVRLFGTRDVLDALPSRRSVNTVREAIHDIVAAEGPVHHDRLAKLACAAFNLNKVNGERANSVLMALDTSLHRRDADGFVWDTSIDPAAWFQFRINGPDIERKPEHISVVEMSNAMVDVVRSSGGISVGDLHRETIRLFGGKRRTAGITLRLNQGLQYGVQNQRLILREEMVFLPV